MEIADAVSLTQEPVVRVRDLRVKYGSTEILHGISFDVRRGETVVITREDEPVAEIRPLRNGKGRRPIGLAKGEFVVPDDFDDPLPDDILDAFEGK